MLVRLNNINNTQSILPMTHFTPNELKPSEKTLRLIRQIAYSYQVLKNADKPCACCMS